MADISGVAKLIYQRIDQPTYVLETLLDVKEYADTYNKKLPLELTGLIKQLENYQLN